jgi:predicted RNase H-like HicB family nuclease
LSYTFCVVIEEDEFEDGARAFHASCPALSGCHTWGLTHQEALTNIKEAVALYIEDIVAAGEQIPEDIHAEESTLRVHSELVVSV